MQIFSCKTRILAGTGAVAELGKLGIRRLLLVADPYFVKQGWVQRIEEAAKPEALELFDQVVPDPGVELAAEGTAAVRAFQPDTVVALGGGSAMDCAKAMAWFSGLQLKLIAIPTTSGSGAEVTNFAVLTHGNLKYPLVEEGLQPDIAILDDELLGQMPPGLVADSGFDVLTHAVEAYTAQGASAISDALARDAFCTVFESLADSFAGHRENRLDIHVAATMAGMAFQQAGLGLCHAMAHALGGAFHLPHGRLNAILLPEVIHANREAGGKYAALARAAGLGGSAEVLGIRNLKNGLIRLRRELDMPQTLAQAGVDLRKLREKTEVLVKEILEDPCCKGNPVPVTAETVGEVLQRVSGHG